MYDFLFTCLRETFEADTLKFWWSPIWFFFCCFGIISKTLLPNLRSYRFILVFSFKTLIVITFRLLIHFELMFVYSLRWESNFILLYVYIQLSQNLLKRLFPPWNCLSTCAKNLFIDHICISQFYLIDLYVYPNASTTLHSLL